MSISKINVKRLIFYTGFAVRQISLEFTAKKHS